MRTTERVNSSPARIPVLLLLAAIVAAAVFGIAPAHAATDALRCATFDELTTGTRYVVGNRFGSSLEFEMRSFTWTSGTITAAGYAEVSSALGAAGSGNELLVNNANVRLLLPSPSGVTRLTLRYGEYGGNVNFAVNGDLRNVENFALLDGATVGGARVSVTGGLGHDSGEIQIVGAIASFAVGGQEFFVDDLCIVKGETTDPVDPQHPDRRPDLGDAPDSSNGRGITNIAYAAAGTPGRFPTVWGSTPAGEAAGPKHLNDRIEGVLGKGVTAEADAEPPAADVDVINNILAGSVDNANNDRLDDGWRNPGAPMAACQETTLIVRVTRGTAATLERMFLNVWFDGNRDGDWEDTGICEGEQFAGGSARSYEWIVQDFAVNMGAIPRGASVDIPVTTRLLLATQPTSTENLHWLRFTLSEQPAIVAPTTALADGRGPSAPDAYLFGETEDYLRRHEQPGLAGTLVLTKTVEAGTAPIQPGAPMTYTLRLEHQGGTAPALTTLIDELPAGTVLAGPVKVIEETPYVAPLVAHVSQDRVKWTGSLMPGARIAVVVPVRLVRCPGQPAVIVNTATALQTDGSRISSTTETAVQCPPVPPVSVTKRIVEERGGAEHELTESDIVPGMVVRFRFHLANNGAQPVVVPLRDRLPDGMVTVDEGSIGPLFDRIFRLGAGEEKNFDLRAKLVAEVAADSQLVNVARYVVCPVSEKHGIQCAWPEEESPAILATNRVTLTVRGFDLGDAPDSTNHFMVGMSAYKGVPADFATVIDASARVQGPAHADPLPFHLGKSASREANADIGPDADPGNNILPATDRANLDLHDDGVAAGRLTFHHCQRAEIPIQIFISAAAAAQLEQGTGYLNVWVDGTRNGAWGEAVECVVQDGEAARYAFEHVVIDYPVDVAALGPGLHTLVVPTSQAVLWPDDRAEKPAWIRVTLSERPANKTLSAGGVTYGDGRGYELPFRLGETEDYLWRNALDPAMGPDLFIYKQGAARSHATEAIRTNATAEFTYGGIVWVIEYGNRGLEAAANVRISDDLVQAGDLTDIFVESFPAVSYTRNGTYLTFDVGSLEPGQHGRIVIKSGIPSEAGATTYRNIAVITGESDVNMENNQATATVELKLLPPVIVEPGNGTICDGEVTVRGRALPGSTVDLFIDGGLAASVTADSGGVWRSAVTLADGDHELYAVARLGSVTSEPSPTIYVTVDSTLAWSPLSLRFTNELGWQHRPVDEHGRTDESGWATRLRPGETYTVSVRLCCSESNASVQMVVDEGETVELYDLDGDGLYAGAFVASNEPHTASTFRIVATCGSAAVEGSGMVLIDPEGVVYDVGSALPVAGATVACMQSQATMSASSSDAIFGLWPAAEFGQINPQSTAADGYFSFMTPVGVYRLEARGSGYQPYRSTDVQVVSEAVRYDIPLTPLVGDASRRILITENGFEPAYLAVRPGEVVEWVNMAADSHSAASWKSVAGAAVGGATFDSGLLLAGESYQFRFDMAGAFSYVDATNPANTASIVVSANAPYANSLFIPVIRR